MNSLRAAHRNGEPHSFGLGVVSGIVMAFEFGTN